MDEHRFVAGLSLLRNIIDDHANSWHILALINFNAPLRPLRKPLLFRCHAYKFKYYHLDTLNHQKTTSAVSFERVAYEPVS